jgi:succinoglycan biosynthesis protein ExoM
MATELPHVCVCICTYKRPELLKVALEALRGQDTGGLFTFSIVVVDNDEKELGREVATAFENECPFRLTYYVEPKQGIALARNKAVANATGDFVAFLDDDEHPDPAWLANLLASCQATGADGVLGPVRPHFDAGAPQWVLKCGFYDRPEYPTGTVLQWRETRTGNVLFKRGLLALVEPPFRPQFRSGEDTDFFRRLMAAGRKFTWCNEAAVLETIPPVRWTRRFMLRRALLRGTCAAYHATAMGVVKSLVAVPLYLAALPLAQVSGHHRFMALLVKLCDHLGKLLALIGINAVKEPYVSE